MFREPSELAVTSAFAVPQACSRSGDGGLVGVSTYRMLTGCDPADARIDDDLSFDRHVFASILAAAAMDGDAVAELAGLTADQLAALFARCFPQAPELATAWCVPAASAGDSALDDEVAMVRDLLLANRSTAGDAGRWLAAMIARRSMQPNHLWEDLGLRARPELTRLLTRHFASIAARNTKNMRWKRFFYRMLCEDDGLVMCSTPVCTQCRDFDLCFGEESGESRLAYQRRQFELQAMQLSERGS